ncbi:MAG: carboxy terminal-processing peptidase [Candidatus Xiphinematobacter sp.]|nr:MAG: carboxy terminal-processing peptidase [Candidatus Xiphinematobacter sp.]
MQHLTILRTACLGATLGIAAILIGSMGSGGQVKKPTGTRFGHVVERVAAEVTLLAPKVRADSSLDPGQVEMSVARILEQGHYTRQKLDSTKAQQTLESYLRLLDPNRLYLLRGDIDSFYGKYLPTLKNSILHGDLTPARGIYAVYKQRVENRVARNKIFLKQALHLSSNETIALNREKSTWPRHETEADNLWKNWLRAQILQERLVDASINKSVQQNGDHRTAPLSATKRNSARNTSGGRFPSTFSHINSSSPLKGLSQKAKTAEEIVARRLDNILRTLKHEESFGVVAKFLSALSQSYDPHSDYLSPQKMENFAISMRLSLVGIGAVLQDADGYARVVDILPGGPADRDGRLKVNDCIVGVAQGNTPFEDMVNTNLERVVERIRGKKGTLVRLLVVPGDSLDSSERRLIVITRDEVRLKDQQARAEVIDLEQTNGSITRIGWIMLPSFYADIDSRVRVAGSRPNTTRDVSMLLRRLEKEGIQGLIVDLRRNGGGSLQEAINLTGFFIPRGPVLQIKDSMGRISISCCEDAGHIYRGPLVVLVNHLSASASEIFAAALQDYGRAVIVGDSRTFSKGTVQTVLDVGRFMPFFSLAAADAGSLKLTIQKFYRIKGGSTQLRGVESDIVLPSLLDHPKIGETALPNALPYDEVSPVPFRRFSGSLFLDQLRRRSSARVASDPEFVYIREEMARVHKRLDENTVSLNEEVRRAEIEELRARETRLVRELALLGPRIKMKAYSVTLDNVHHPQLKPIRYGQKSREAKRHPDPLDGRVTSLSKLEEDPIKTETLRIAQDLVHLGAETRKSQAPTLHQHCDGSTRSGDFKLQLRLYVSKQTTYSFQNGGRRKVRLYSCSY